MTVEGEGRSEDNKKRTTREGRWEKKDKERRRKNSGTEKKVNGREEKDDVM